MIRTATRDGFTLFELMITVTILFVFLAVIILALNPAAVLDRSRNVARREHVEDIANAINLYRNDDPDGFFANITLTSDYQMITDGEMTYPECMEGCETELIPEGGITGCIDMSALVPDYMKKLPRDPGAPDSASTHYYVSKENSALTVGACKADLDEDGEVLPSIVVVR